MPGKKGSDLTLADVRGRKYVFCRATYQEDDGPDFREFLVPSQELPKAVIQARRFCTVRWLREPDRLILIAGAYPREALRLFRKGQYET